MKISTNIILKHYMGLGGYNKIKVVYIHKKSSSGIG